VSLDLSAAVEAAARALAELAPDEEWPTNEALGGNPTGTRDDEYRAALLDDARNAVAAAPLIEAQVRAQVAAEIEAIRPDDGTTDTFYTEEDKFLAARIVRGESS
jgi:hypothetical protein